MSYTIFASVSPEDKKQVVKFFNEVGVPYRELGEKKLEIRHTSDKDTVMRIAKFCMGITAHSVNVWQEG